MSGSRLGALPYRFYPSVCEYRMNASIRRQVKSHKLRALANISDMFGLNPSSNIYRGCIWVLSNTMNNFSVDVYSYY